MQQSFETLFIPVFFQFESIFMVGVCVQWYLFVQRLNYPDISQTQSLHYMDTCIHSG